MIGLIANRSSPFTKRFKPICFHRPHPRLKPIRASVWLRGKYFTPSSAGKRRTVFRSEKTLFNLNLKFKLTIHNISCIMPNILLVINLNYSIFYSF